MYDGVRFWKSAGVVRFHSSVKLPTIPSGDEVTMNSITSIPAISQPLVTGKDLSVIVG